MVVAPRTYLMLRLHRGRGRGAVVIFFLRHVSMGRAGFKYVYPLVDKFSLYLEYLVTYILGNSYRFYLAGQMSRYGKTLHAFSAKPLLTVELSLAAEGSLPFFWSSGRAIDP